MGCSLSKNGTFWRPEAVLGDNGMVPFKTGRTVTLENGCTTYTFAETVADIPVEFHIIKMKSCLFVWIGNKCTFENLAVAVNTKYSSLPIATSIMGHFGDDNSCSLATKLSKKTGKQVFASFNLSNADNNVLLSVNKRLMEEFAKHPEKF